MGGVIRLNSGSYSSSSNRPQEVSDDEEDPHSDVPLRQLSDPGSVERVPLRLFRCCGSGSLSKLGWNLGCLR